MYYPPQNITNILCSKLYCLISNTEVYQIFVSDMCSIKFWSNLSKSNDSFVAHKKNRHILKESSVWYMNSWWYMNMLEVKTDVMKCFSLVLQNTF